MISFFRVSGVPQKGEARTPLTRKKEIARTQSSPKDAGTDAGTDADTGAGAGTDAGPDTDADTDTDAA